MSNAVTSLLRSRSLEVGFTGKAILLLMGDLASDDGSGIWASKGRMARELETTDRTIRRTIDKLIEGGFLIETGRRNHLSGYTFEYQIDVERIAGCPESTPHARTHCPPDTLSPIAANPVGPDVPLCR